MGALETDFSKGTNKKEEVLEAEIEEHHHIEDD